LNPNTNRQKITAIRLAQFATICIASCVAASLLLATADAHHSAAAYDVEKTIEVTGTVTEFRWKNPHTLVRLAVTDAHGVVVIWNFEGNGASGLVRNGWRRSLLAVGQHVTIHANPLRNAAPGGRLQGVTLADGSLVGRSSAQ